MLWVMSLALSPKYVEVLTSSNSQCDHVEVLTAPPQLEAQDVEIFGNRDVADIISFNEVIRAGRM